MRTYFLDQEICRDEQTRTVDLHVPNVARYQLCYIPYSLSGGKGTLFSSHFKPQAVYFTRILTILLTLSPTLSGIMGMVSDREETSGVALGHSGIKKRDPGTDIWCWDLSVLRREAR